MSDSSTPQSLSPLEATRRRVGLGLLLLFAGAYGSNAGGDVDASGAPTPAPLSPSPGTPAPQASPPASPAGRTEFPLRREGAKRHLVDANGGAFLLQGDSPWSLLVEATREQVDQYLDDRVSRGFNTLLTNLIEHEFASNPPRNAYGDAPFVNGDFAQPNEAYFAHADWVLRRAASKGFLVLLVPAYAGAGGGSQGWYREMIDNGSAKMRTYGRYLGQRYSSYTNILWTHGGDYNPPQRALFTEIAAGIREFDTRALHSAHCGPGTAAVEYWGGQPWLQVNSVFTYESVYSRSLAQYARSDAMPFFFIEGRYENESNDGDEHRVRVQAYQTLLCGAMGQLFGNNPVWHFATGGIWPYSGTWQQALDSPGARSMTHLSAAFASRAWWNLVPDARNTFLTSGLGSNMDRAVAARSSDGTFAMAYLPSARAVSVNLSQLAGPRVAARWFDPSAGAYTAVTGSPFAATGSRSFQPSQNNASGHGDWLLVLESTA